MRSHLGTWRKRLPGLWREGRGTAFSQGGAELWPEGEASGPQEAAQPAWELPLLRVRVASSSVGFRLWAHRLEEEASGIWAPPRPPCALCTDSRASCDCARAQVPVGRAAAVWHSGRDSEHPCPETAAAGCPPPTPPARAALPPEVLPLAATSWTLAVLSGCKHPGCCVPGGDVTCTPSKLLRDGLTVLNPYAVLHGEAK